MSKVYMVRHENGDSTIVQAENEHEALELAGIAIDVDEFARENGMEVNPELHVSLRQSGIGPQRYSIREIHTLHINVRLTAEGRLEFGPDTEDFLNDIYSEYPHLVEADRITNGDFVEQATWGNAAVMEQTRLSKAGLGLDD